MVIKSVSVSKPSRAPHAGGTHSAEVIVVRASSSNTTRRRYHQRLKREAESEAGDVIDLGAPRLQRRKPPVRRKPGRVVPDRSPYTPNSRLYPGPGVKPKPRPKRAEARGNDCRGRRHKRVYRRPVPNSRLYRPAPLRAPPPPACPRTTWPSPAPPARLETASRVALRLSEQRPWTPAPQHPQRAAYLPVQAEHSLVQAAHSPVQAVRSVLSPVRAARSSVRATRTPVGAVRSPARPVRLPVGAARTPVRAVRSPVGVVHSSVRTVRSPVSTVRSPVSTVRSPVGTVRSPVSAVRSPVRAVRSPLRAVSSLVRQEISPGRAWCQLPPPPTQFSPSSRHLAVTLPAPRYRPASEYFRLRSLDTDSDASSPVAALAAVRAPPPAAAPLTMDTGNRQSTSPEDCSEGNETLSAPSEFLAEFLSAIMQRQYAEALKYCRLILQYEPHNATARGFYPLLQHKVQAHQRAVGGWARGSSSEETSAHADKPPGAQEMMEQGADESDDSAPASRGASRSSSRSRGSCASQSSLELDSSDALAHSSPSLSLSRRTERTDSASAGCCESTGSLSRSEPDDNGNAPASLPACAADVQNDNAAPPHKSESAASLRRLRAQFTCSIK